MKGNKIPQCFCGEKFNDYQRDTLRKSVCRNNPVVFKDERGNKYCVFHYPSNEKKEEFESVYYEKTQREDYIFLGTWFPIEIDFTDHQFENYADFSSAEFTQGANFEGAKFKKNCSFNSCKFLNKVSFKSVEFLNNETYIHPIDFYSVEFKNIADFSYSIFKFDCTFSKARFEVGYDWNSNEDFLKFTNQTGFFDATFEGKADFEDVIFGKQPKNETYDSFTFSEATFKHIANFKGAEFWFHTNFSKAEFEKAVDFTETTIKQSLNFNEARFMTFARFSAKNKNYTYWNKDGLDFSNAEIEKPERIFFQSVPLKPQKFINTDIRKFDFTDIDWNVKNFWFDWSRFKDFKWWSKEARERKSGYISLEKVYRRFASYAEDNNDYRSASKFRFTAFDIQRITPWYGRLPITLLWWYKWTSRYGESPKWSAMILMLLVFAFFPYVYSNLSFKTCAKDRPISTSIAVCESTNETVKQNCSCSDERLSYGEAVIQSVATATLQNLEYRKPMTWRGEIWILLEKILAPVQTALLALAIRRKVMR